MNTPKSPANPASDDQPKGEDGATRPLMPATTAPGPAASSDTTDTRPVAPAAATARPAPRMAKAALGKPALVPPPATRAAPGKPAVASPTPAQAEEARVAQLRPMLRPGLSAGPALMPQQPSVAPAGKPVLAAAPAKGVPLPVAPPVRASITKRRHFGILFSLVLCVLLPSAATALYLWGWATNQYASYVAFSVRNEQASSALEILGGITQLSGSSSSDTDILYEFIQSQELVAKIDTDLDLRTLWSKPGHSADPLFTYQPPGTIEDLLDYWGRMVQISYDAASGLIELRVLAFDPNDARNIAERIYAECTAMINQLSDIAREDAISYARLDLDSAVEQLKVARAAITAFRNTNQIVDPTLDIRDQMGLLNTLQQQLGAAMVELDILRETTRADDPRITQTERKIRVIENRIEEERRKVGIGTGAEGGEVFADLVGDYERLIVDLQFAEQSYTAAQATYNGALAEAKRQSRYLAAHIRPTLAEKSQFPQRPTILALVALFAFLLWAVLVLVAYSLKDRR